MSSSRKNTARKKVVSTPGGNNTKSTRIEFEAAVALPGGTKTDTTNAETFSYEEVRDLSTVTPAAKRAGKGSSSTSVVSRTVVVVGSGAKRAGSAATGSLANGKGRSQEPALSKEPPNSRNNGTSTNDEREGGAARRRRQRQRTETTATSPSRTQTGTEREPAPTTKSPNTRRTANGAAPGKSRPENSAVLRAESAKKSTGSEGAGASKGRKLSLPASGKGRGSDELDRGNKTGVTRRRNGGISKSMSGGAAAGAGIGGEKRKRSSAATKEVDAGSRGSKHGKEARVVPAAVAGALLASKMPPYPRIDYTPSGKSVTLKDVLQESVAAEMEGLIRARRDDPTCTAAVRACVDVSKELIRQAWDMSIGLEIVRPLDLEEARRMLEEEKAKVAKYEEEERLWQLEEDRLMALAANTTYMQQNPSDVLAAAEEGDDASSVHSEGIGTAKKTSDLLLAATEDMILKAGAISRGLREMGAEVAEAQETKDVLVREFRKHTLKNYPNVDDPKAGIAAMLS